MNWTALAIVVALLIAVFLLKRAGQVPVREAQAYLKGGALVIDVRSTGEFAGGHLPKAINIPLDQIESGVPRRVPDKNKVLLLHCASGMRSGTAKGKLKAMGYTNAFNLGSYSRAAGIVGRN